MKLQANGIATEPSRSLAWTLTFSPCVNGLEGTKLAPSPCEYAISRPAWAPLSEPLTVTRESSLAAGPSMLICVDTEESRDSGAGETVTREPASAAEMFSRGGVQLGETLGSLNLLALALASAPARDERSAGSATSPAAAISSAAPAIAARRGVLRPLTP